MMKNILIVVLLVTTLASFAFGYIQKLEADSQREKAIVAQRMAEMQQQEAEQQRKMAEEARMEAEIQRALALKALNDCEKSKR